MIYVSFPGGPDAYPAYATYNPELSHHILYGLKKKYGNVTWVPFYQVPSSFDSKNDIMVTQVTGNYHGVPRNRVILVDNSNFESNKWFYADKARYTKYGINRDNEIDGANAFAGALTDVENFLCLSNDVAIERWNTNHPDVVQFKEYLKKTITNIDMAPHPLDKSRYLRFFNSDYIPGTPKLLLYHAGMRKNSVQLWKMLKDMGYREGTNFVQTPEVNKNDHNLLREINQNFHIVANCSYSESGPINMIEYMYQGLLVYGHEEWWNAYGYNKTLWTYDPNKHQEMQENIRWLMDQRNLEEIRVMRNHIVNISTNRVDNTWPYFLEKLYTMVDSLL